MSGQVAEYISFKPINEWTSLEELIDGFTFDNDKKYSIFNNGASTILFSTATAEKPEFFGSILSQKDTIWYNKGNAGTLFVKGENFNLAIWEV